MAKTAWVVYNKDGAIKAKRVPEGKSAEELSFFIRNTIGGTPIRAVQAADNATAKKLAMSAPGSTEEIAEPEDRSSADRAAELAALYDISFEDAMDEISKRPQESQARIEGREPSWTDKAADFSSSIPRSLYAMFPGDESYEERQGDLGLQSNPSIMPTAAAMALTAPLSIPAAALITGATQIGSEGLMDPEYNSSNAIVDASTMVPFAAIPGGMAAWKAIPPGAKQAAAKGAGVAAKETGKFLERQINKVPFGEMITWPVRKAAEKITSKPAAKAAQEQVDMFSAAPVPKAPSRAKEYLEKEAKNYSDIGARIMLPAARPLWEEDVRANYMPRTSDYQDFIKYPGQPNRKLTPEEALILRGDLGFLDSLNLEEDQ